MTSTEMLRQSIHQSLFYVSAINLGKVVSHGLGKVETVTKIWSGAKIEQGGPRMEAKSIPLYQKWS